MERYHEAVTLMTIHNAKGLDSIVFMIDSRRIFSAFNSLEDPTDIEEERRLCYVRKTRAQQRLTLSCAIIATVFGQRKCANHRASHEIPQEHVDTQISDLRTSFSDTEQPKPAPI